MDKEFFSQITHICAADIDIIREEERIYVVHDHLCQCVLDKLEDEGYLVDVGECPFGYCSSGCLDAHCVIYR